MGLTEKSAVAEHTLSQDGHRIQFDKTEVLASTTNYYPRLFREAIEIQKHTNNFNKKDEGISIHRVWFSALKNTKCKTPKPDQSEEATPTDSSIKIDSAPKRNTVGDKSSQRSLRPLPHRL